jgi:hypothetical protein
VNEKSRNVDKVKKYVEYTTYEDLPIQAEIVSALQATQNGTRATIHDSRTRVQKKHGKRYLRCAFSENAEKKGTQMTTVNECDGNPDVQPAERPHALRPLNRIAVILPPETSLPVSDRVYAMDVAVLDDPIAPTPRDLLIVERLGSLMCQPEEVVALCGLTRHQFNATESLHAAWARGRERAKARLRLAQWDAAMTGSERMLVHLGKQYLDQADKSEDTTPDKEEKNARNKFRDKLADAIDRAAEKRVARIVDGSGETRSTQDVVPVGEGQPTAPSA